MGGRGSVSATVRGSSSRTSNADIELASSAKEVADILRSKYPDIYIDGFFEQLGVEKAISAGSALEEVFNEFGVLPNISMLSAGKYKPSTLGKTSTKSKDGNLLASIFMNLDANEHKYGDASMDGVKGTMAHELGHVITSHITNIEYNTKLDRIDAYNKNKVATSIMTKAINNIKKTEFGQGKSAQQLRRSISPYAGHYTGGNGNAEAFAEAIDDFVIHGKNANPLSLEVVKITKERLGR